MDSGKVPCYNMMNGFDLWTYDSDPTKIARIPFDVDGNSIKTDGDTVTGFTWVSRNEQLAPTNYLYNNGSESDIENYKVPALFDADSNLTTPVLYNHTTFEALRISYDDREYDYGNEHFIFSNAEAKKWRDFMVYNRQQTGYDYTRLIEHTDAPPVNLWTDTETWNDNEYWVD